MNAVLFDEFPILVDRVLAKNIGLNEAIVIQQLHYWIMQNKRQNNNYIDGRYWTYNSLEKWQQDTFYFWSVDTVKRTFKKLEKNGLIIVGNYNKKGYDRTKWYSINYELLSSKCCNNSLGQNAPMHQGNLHQCIRADCTNASGQNAPTYTKDYTETTTDITQPPIEVEEKIKQYFNLDEKDIKKVANAHLATGKKFDYLVEKLELVKNNPNIRDTVGYLISAIKSDYKISINQPKCFIPNTRFHNNCNQNFMKYGDDLEKHLFEQQKDKFN